MAGRLKWVLLGLLVLATFTRSLAETDVDDDFDVEDDDTGDDDSDYADVEEFKARLVIRKIFDADDLVQNKNATFTVEVFNAGTSSAKDVEIKDSVPSSFKLVDGSTSKKFDTIAIGSKVDFSYIVLPTEAGPVLLDSVTVKYVSDAESDTVQVGSSLATKVVVLSLVDKIAASALNVGSYLTVGVISTAQQWLTVAYFIGGVLALVAFQRSYKYLSEANKRWKYQRALKEVEKMQ